MLIADQLCVIDHEWVMYNVNEPGQCVDILSSSGLRRQGLILWLATYIAGHQFTFIFIGFCLTSHEVVILLL